MRITRKYLEHVLGRIAQTLGRTLILDHASCYGGYRVETPEGRTIPGGVFPPRYPPKVMAVYLEGIEMGIRLAEENGLKTKLDRAWEAVSFMSGSDDFSEGGKARAGFEEVVFPVLREMRLPKEPSAD